MKTMKTMKNDEPKRRVEGLLLKKTRVDFVARVATLTAAATLSTSAWADGPITLWYQRGGNPEQQRILQKDLVEPFNAAHPTTPLTLDVLAGGSGDKKIRMAVISGKGPDIVMTPGPSTTLALVQWTNAS
jgi:raffinose/stachyose/melibiose transport system substrate-binding protein